MSEPRFYVYVHRRADDGQPFYVGKGSGRRAWSDYNRNAYWRATVAKHGLTVQITQRSDSERSAFRAEMATIAALSGIGVPLTNMTAGGEGLSGYKHTAEAREKVAASKRGKARPVDVIERSAAARRGQVYGAQTRAKMSASATGRPMSPEAIAKSAAFHTGRKRPPESLARMSAAQKGRPGRPLTPEHKAMLVACRTGSKHSEESKQRMAEAARKRWAAVREKKQASE